MKRLNQQAGFTLIEMLIVLLIISILILITIPNVTKHFATIDKKGCTAYISTIDMKNNLIFLKNPLLNKWKGRIHN